jgi:hypothetical protein
LNLLETAAQSRFSTSNEFKVFSFVKNSLNISTDLSGCKTKWHVEKAISSNEGLNTMHSLLMNALKQKLCSITLCTMISTITGNETAKLLINILSKEEQLEIIYVFYENSF